VTLPATGRQLRRLEQRGLVTLEPDLSDRRVTRVRLTQAGMDVRGSIIADRKAAIRRAVRDVGGPEVVDGLQRLAVALGSATAPPAKISRRVKVAAR
jgi:DNA-binding MarR family transcriptional regulator